MYYSHLSKNIKLVLVETKTLLVSIINNPVSIGILYGANLLIHRLNTVILHLKCTQGFGGLVGLSQMLHSKHIIY